MKTTPNPIEAEHADNLPQMTPLRHTYYVLRHGRSLANDAELIISHPDNGLTEYGLSDEGRRQVAATITEALQNKVLDETTWIVASDFARTRETAEIAAQILGTENLLLTPKLRERFFGDWEKTNNSNYQRVWDEDAVDGGHKSHGVESTREVLSRTTALIQELEEQEPSRSILLVSHGDALQILQTAFERVASAQHRALRHLETGEIRQLHLKSLPAV
jgi:broad specificity phosphatase PhoE